MARKRSKNITQEQVAKIRELKEQGVSSAEIAKIIGCGRSTVNGKLKELGVVSKYKRSRLTGEQISKIRELTDKNYGSEQIAAIVGCCADTVNRIQRDRGFRKKERYLTQDQINNILRLTTERYTQDEIAKRVGVSVFTVRKYQQINELPASNRSESSGKHTRYKYMLKKNNKDIKDFESCMTPRNSGRYPWPEETEKPIETIENVISLNEKKEENAMKNILAKSDYINILDASITISGNATSFDYSVDIFNGILRIDAGVGVPVEIPFKNIAGFANELADVAEKVESMRKIFQSA